MEQDKLTRKLGKSRRARCRSRESIRGALCTYPSARKTYKTPAPAAAAITRDAPRDILHVHARRNLRRDEINKRNKIERLIINLPASVNCVSVVSVYFFVFLIFQYKTLRRE